MEGTDDEVFADFNEIHDVIATAVQVAHEQKCKSVTRIPTETVDRSKLQNRSYGHDVNQRLEDTLGARKLGHDAFYACDSVTH